MNKEEKNINNNFNESQLPKERTLTVYERDKEEKKYSFANKNNLLVFPEPLSSII